MTAGVGAGPGPRLARAQQQRDRILDAAQQCFAERGFHGASMAMIADTAEMSAGLIYRYFAGKSELIHGIVSRQVDLLAHDLEELESGVRDPVTTIVDSYREHADDEPRPATGQLDATLILEIVAESRRDPVIAEALALLDQRIDGSLGAWLARPRAQGGFGVSASALPARTLILRSVLDGLKMRQVREPELDVEVLREAIEFLPPALQDNA